jgi:hypothetical protein
MLSTKKPMPIPAKGSENSKIAQFFLASLAMAGPYW